MTKYPNAPGSWKPSSVGGLRELWINTYRVDDEREFFIAYQSKEQAEENTPDGWCSTKFVEDLDEAIARDHDDHR